MKGAAEFQRLLGQFEQSGMANPENNVLYSGAQQQAQQQSGVNNPFSFAGNFVRKLMDKYKDNERLKQEYRDQNPGGYPGMPQNLRERMRRNEMGIGNQSNLGGDNLIAGYDPAFGDTFGSDDADLNMAIPDPNRPEIFGSDVLDELIRQEKVRRPSMGNTRMG